MLGIGRGLEAERRIRKDGGRGRNQGEGSNIAKGQRTPHTHMKWRSQPCRKLEEEHFRKRTASAKALWWTQLCHITPNSNVEALTSNMAVFGDRAFKELINFKWCPKIGTLTWWSVVFVRKRSSARELPSTLSLHTHKRKSMRRHSEEAAICKPGGEVSLQTILSGTWWWTSNLQNHEEIRYHCLKHLARGTSILLGQPEQMNVGSEAEMTSACRRESDGRECWEMRWRSQDAGHLGHEEESRFHAKGDGCLWKICFKKRMVMTYVFKRRFWLWRMASELEKAWPPGKGRSS